MKIGPALVTSAVAVLLGATPGAAGPVDPTLPNIVPMFPEVARPGPNWAVTNRLGGPTLEWEVLTVNIGGQDWVRPPIDRSATCVSSIQYFRMPQTWQFTLYWYDPDLLEYVLIDLRRKETICIWDDSSRSDDPQLSCLREHGSNFTCGCNSALYGPGTGNGVSLGWADSYFRGLTGQSAFIGSYTGDFLLANEFDPDSDLQAPDLLDREKDATHADNISYAYFTWDGVGVTCGFSTCVDNVVIQYMFDPICGP